MGVFKYFDISIGHYTKLFIFQSSLYPMAIKVVALDIYGTILASSDADNELPPRKGTVALFEKCRNKGIVIVTSSDANIETLKIDLHETFSKHKLDDLLSQIDDYYRCVPIKFKDYSSIIRDYGIKPRQLFVLGDRDVDINGAKAVGASYFHVPEYHDEKDYDNFDLGKIRIR
jgi:FMN phosphatase YigB (HAD superfamily)